MALNSEVLKMPPDFVFLQHRIQGELFSICALSICAKLDDLHVRGGVVKRIDHVCLFLVLLYFLDDLSERVK